MPIAIAKLKPIDVVDICDAARAGKTREEISDELDVNEHTIRRYLLHIDDGSKRDAIRQIILDRANAGDSIDAIASRVRKMCHWRYISAHRACSDPAVKFVADVLRSRHLEEQARRALTLDVEPPRTRRRPTFDEVHGLRAKLSALRPDLDIGTIREMPLIQLERTVRKEDACARWATYAGSRKELAKELGIHDATLHKWLREKRVDDAPATDPTVENIPPERD